MNVTEITNEAEIFDISEKSFTLVPGASKDLYIQFNPEAIESIHVFVIKSEGLSDTTIHVFGSYTEPIPSIPELINPDHSSIHVSVNPVFKWTSVQYATGYDFNLISESDTIVSRSISDTTITDLTLEFSSSYQWQVRASNRQGKGE